MANILNYVKTLWKAGREGGTAWTPERLNNIEDGIEQATNQINTNSENIEQATNQINQINENIENIITDINQINNNLIWKTLGSSTGTNKIDMSGIPSTTKEILISVWTNDGNNHSRIFQNIITYEQLVSSNTYDIYSLGSYIHSTTDFGYANININKSYVQIRHYLYSGKDLISSAKIKVRYR